jgi:acyl-CoA synthetase (AMP-forming)/AMP-acid ligase II
MLLIPPGPECAVALLALCAYHSCVPVNPSCTKDELKQDVSRLGVKAILTTKEIAAHLELQSLQCEGLELHVILIETRSTGPVGLFDLSPAGVNGHAINTTFDLNCNALNDVSLILHTSGTNGKKKVVRYTLRALIVSAWCVVHSWDLKSSDVNCMCNYHSQRRYLLPFSVNMMPLFHVGGIVRNLFAPVLSGGSTIVCTGFDPDAFWAYAFEPKATWCVL